MHQSNASFAATVAALFAAAACGGTTPAAEEPITAEAPSAQTVKCLGIHSCKGQSACGVEGGHACAGQNDCKGKGWVKVSADECASKGGTVL